MCRNHVVRDDDVVALLIIAGLIFDGLCSCQSCSSVDEAI